MELVLFWVREYESNPQAREPTSNHAFNILIITASLLADSGNKLREYNYFTLIRV